MKLSLKIEEVFMCLLGVFLFSQLSYSWWWFLLLILTPDIGMLGYLVNQKVGAITYNLFHHKALAVLMYFIGVYFEVDTIKLVGVILFSHASLDRVFGYGLKYYDRFQNTHLGNIGRR